MLRRRTIGRDFAVQPVLLIRECNPSVRHSAITSHAGSIAVLLGELKAVLCIISEEIRFFHLSQIVASTTVQCIHNSEDKPGSRIQWANIRPPRCSTHKAERRHEERVPRKLVRYRTPSNCGRQVMRFWRRGTPAVEWRSNAVKSPLADIGFEVRRKPPRHW